MQKYNADPYGITLQNRRPERNLTKTRYKNNAGLQKHNRKTIPFFTKTSWFYTTDLQKQCQKTQQKHNFTKTQQKNNTVCNSSNGNEF